jgi:pimeloyl-ACP methyl ester carboxylesterase
MSFVRVIWQPAITFLIAVSLECGFAIAAPVSPPPAPRVLGLTASDGVILKASYFAAGRPGPGMLLLHQGNRQREDWDRLAEALARAGINTLTLDMRGFGESGGSKPDHQTAQERSLAEEQTASDLDAAFQALLSQPGVRRNDIGLGGAGALGVNNAVRTAARHRAEVKSLVLLSGETFQDGLRFLGRASDLPELFVVANDDEYPPTVEAMEWLYARASSGGKTFIRYPGAKAPWKGFESAPWLPATGSHGTDLFSRHPELVDTIARWSRTTLIRAPGHAPSSGAPSAVLPSAPVLKLLDAVNTEAVERQLMRARRHNPDAQLFPEINANIIGYDYLRAGDAGSAVRILELVTIAYPRSADAFDSLGDAYLAAGEKDLARQSAEKALALLNADTPKGSSWSETDERRAVIRRNSEQNLKQLQAH